MENEKIMCPKCGEEKRQHKKGYTCSGSQRMYCCNCGCKYTPQPKNRACSEEIRKQALRLLALGDTGRGIGKALNRNRSNAYRWAREETKKQKDVWVSPQTNLEAFELDGIFWFTNSRKGHENGVNTSFWRRHYRNVHNKNDAHTIEGTNADIRHYIAGLRRKSRCFFRSMETLKAVLSIVIDAYNQFGEAKRAYKERHPHCGRDFPFDHLQFI